MAYRFRYGDHLVLQEQGCHPTVPDEHREQLAMLHLARNVAADITQRMGETEENVGLFKTRPVCASEAVQRQIESTVTALELPCTPSRPSTTLVSGDGLSCGVYCPYSSGFRPSSDVDSAETQRSDKNANQMRQSGGKKQRRTGGTSALEEDEVELESHYDRGGMVRIPP